MNITDPDSKLMSAANRGFLQGFSAQAVATQNQITIACGVTADGNDYAQLKPMIEQAAENLTKAGVGNRVGVVVADAGYLSEDNLVLESELGVELVIATKNRRRFDAGPQRARRAAFRSRVG